eukprot:scaffold226772_cov33-Attheya_sp.AAC.2
MLIIPLFLGVEYACTISHVKSRSHQMNAFVPDSSNKQVHVTLTFKVPGSSCILSNQKFTGNSQIDAPTAGLEAC